MINYALWDKSEGGKVHFKSSGSGKKKDGNMGHAGSIMVEAVKNRLGSYYPQNLNKMRNRDYNLFSVRHYVNKQLSTHLHYCNVEK